MLKTIISFTYMQRQIFIFGALGGFTATKLY